MTFGGYSETIVVEERKLRAAEVEAALLRHELQGSIERYERLKAAHGALDFAALGLGQLAPQLAGGTLNQEDFLYSQRSWEFIAAQYREFSSDPSFVDYFWTWRFTHLPVFRLLDAPVGLPAGSVAL